MRLVFLLVISSVFNLVNATVAFSQGKPVITNAVKKSYNGSNISCAKNNDGEITVTATGGTGTYLYSKDNGNSYQAENVFTGLVNNVTYALIVKDKNTGIVSDGYWVTIDFLNPVTISSDLQIISQPKCFSSADGIISLTAWGGTGALRYSIDNGATFQNSGRFESVAAGTYRVYIIDVNGCNVTSNAVTVKGPAEIKVEIKSKTNATCSNPFGEITLRGTGSTGDYNYSLDGQAFFWKSRNDYHTFSNLSIGMHQLLVKDNYNNCMLAYQFEITTALSANLSGDATLCQGENVGLVINIQRQEGITISNDMYTATYKDNSGQNYTLTNLVKGDNTISLGQLASSKNFTLVSLVSTSGCSGAVSGSANIVVNPSGTWLGLNTDWHEPKNWTCGKVPTSNTNVTIGATKNDPVIWTQVAFANNLAILKGASLKTGNTLQIFGNITTTGTFDATEGTIEFKGNKTQSISGTMFTNKTIANLIVSNSAGLEVSRITGDTLNITVSLAFGTATASLSTGDNITLKSTINGTANIGVVKAQNRIAGKFIVERYINTGTNKSLGQHGKAWLHLATPTIGSSIFESWQEAGKATGKTPIANNLNGFGTLLTTGYNNVPANGYDLYTSGGPSIKVYNTATSSYDKSPVSTNEPVYNENGYMLMVRGDRNVFTSNAAANPVVLRTKGEIITGTTKGIKVPAKSWASIGNPYAAKIYLSNIQMNGLDEFISVWDPKLGGTYGLGAYQTLYKNGANYYAIPGGGSYAEGPVTFIESGQAFFVQSTRTEGSVIFTEEAKVAPAKGNFQRGAGTNAGGASLRTSLYALGSGVAVLSDGNLLLTNDGFNNGVDGLDARKMGNSAENFSILTAGNILTVESRGTIIANDTLFFNMTGMRAQNYRLELVAEKLGTPGMEAWLEDNFLKTKTSLNLGDSTALEFTVSNQPGAAAANRFMVIFRLAAVLPVTFTGVQATKKNDDILVAWTIENELSLAGYEVERSADGLRFSKIGEVAATNKVSGKYALLDKTAGAGTQYYRVKSLDLDGKFSYSIIVKVLVEQTSGSISVYPNPITNGQVNLQLNNQEAGEYSLRLLNPVGQVLLTKKINHAGGNYTEKINWNYQMPRGLYQLEVTSEKGATRIIRVAY